MMNDDFFATCASKYINETWIFIYNRSWLECKEFILPDWSPPDDPARPCLWPSEGDVGGQVEHLECDYVLVGGKGGISGLDWIKRRI